MTRQIGFIAAADGSVVRYEAPPPPTTREGRFEAYYEGIRRTRDWLKGLGFTSLHEADYSVAMEYKRVLFDFRLQIPGNVAHVTSSPQFRPGSTNAIVYRLKDEISSEYCLQLIVGAETSLPPTYIALDENLRDPATFIYKTIVGFLTTLHARRHRLGDALQKLPEDQKQIPDWIDTEAIDV